MLARLKPLWNWYFGTFSGKVVNVFRWCLGLVSLGTAITWWPHVTFYFSSTGFISGAQVGQLNPGMSLFYYYDAPWFVLTMYFLLIALLLVMLHGRYARYCMLFIFALMLSFLNRMPLIEYGGTAVLLIGLFFAMFIDFDRAYKKEPVPAWPVRLLQIQICFVYLFSAIGKLQTPEWFNGMAMHGIAEGSLSYLPISTLFTYAFFTVVGTYGSLFAELSFPFLVWNPSTRRFILAVMLVLHLGIMLVLNVTLFSFMMFAMLALFLTDSDLAACKKFFRFTQHIFAQKPSA